MSYVHLTRLKEKMIRSPAFDRGATESTNKCLPGFNFLCDGLRETDLHLAWRSETQN